MCAACQVFSDNKKPMPLTRMNGYLQPIDILTLDFLGPLQKSNKGNKYVLIGVDMLTRYIFGMAFKGCIAYDVIMLFEKQIFPMFGAPRAVFTRRGSAFISATFKNFCESCDIKEILTSAYSPRSNGLSEIHVKTFKSYLKKELFNKNNEDWDQSLDKILFAMRHKLHTGLKVSPIEMLMGFKAKSPIKTSITSMQNIENKLFVESIILGMCDGNSFIKELVTHERHLKMIRNFGIKNLDKQYQYKQYVDKKTSKHKFQIEDKVLLFNNNYIISNKMHNKWYDPYAIINKKGFNIFIVKELSGQFRNEIVYADRMKFWNFDN